MASTTLALPGVLYVGEDERARFVTHLGPAAGWMIPKGVLGWSHEVSVVGRDSLKEDVLRDAKIVMPEAQIPPARMPLTHQAAQKSPLVAVSGKVVQKLIDAGIRVHTIGADRVTSSFYYLAEGGGEEPVRVEGDLVAAVGAMLGERADNAAIERVLDGLVDRLLRSLSKDRIGEVALELAAALPRAAADGSGTSDVDLDTFEKELADLVGASEKYSAFLAEIAAKIADTNDRQVDIPLFGDARKVSQGPFELEVGSQRVSLVTHERWLASGPLTEPTRGAAPAPAPAPQPKAASVPPPAEPAVAATATPAEPPPNMRPLAAPMSPPRPASNPPVGAPAPEPQREVQRIEPAKVVVIEAPKETEVPPKTEPIPAAAAQATEPVKEAPKTDLGRTALMAEQPKPALAQTQLMAEQAKAAPVEQKAPAVEPRPAPVEPKRDERMATTQKVPRPEKSGLPWLWIILAVVALGLAVRFLLRH